MRLFCCFLRESHGLARDEASGLRNGRWLGKPLGGGPVNMLHVSVHYGPRTLRYTLASKGVRRIANASRIPPHTMIVLVLVLGTGPF